MICVQHLLFTMFGILIDQELGMGADWVLAAMSVENVELVTSWSHIHIQLSTLACARY